MNIIDTIKAIIATVKAVEAALPEPGKGLEKLAAVKTILSEAIDNIESKWPAIEQLIGVLVMIYNARGIFKKK